ncbi:hypothetical protein AcV5_000732 [Taiwanofungus camphoratus]|nr:hypothetical protein AcW2_006640 [Antrodia cinnamomea]KAI0939266.1 hypothetical protein AcV5_000732 [Antrodia cinnamomea]
MLLELNSYFAPQFHSLHSYDTIYLSSHRNSHLFIIASIPKAQMHLPFTPNHIHLISACYPPSAALVTSGPEYLPNSQELSRLTYYASNRPGKINKLSNELEKRVKTDCRKAQAGNTRARASLLITLYIFKALAAECRRDISLLTLSLLSAVNATLSTLSSDLEVAARAASVFTAWTTYTDGHLIGVDKDVTQNYISCLQTFASMGKMNSEDHEVRNRTRLVALAALTASVHSEALYHASTYFKLQVSTIMPALLTPLQDVEIPELDHQAVEIKEQPKFAFLDDFRTRPALERRAASIHLHVDGDKGPSCGDVANASLHALSSLLGHSHGNQAAIIMTAAFGYFEDSGGWDKVDHCRWFAAKAAEWTQYQYRHAVPTRLVECLVEAQDASRPSSRHSTLAAMITTVFTSPTPLVNLSTSDIISSLISLIFRRVSIEPEDVLLPKLVECIASLGTHVYYADQIQDLASELISRLVLIETNGIPGNGRANSEKGRTQAIRCLLAGLLGLIHAADMHETTKADDGKDNKEPHSAGTSPELPSSSYPALCDVHVRPSRRTKIAPEIWHDTLILLCDRDYAVRADYAIALVSYLQKEIPKFGDHTYSDGVKHLRPLVEGPTEQASTMTAMIYGDATTKFLNALHAYIYALSASTTIDLHSSSLCSSPERSLNGNSSFHEAHSRRSMTLPSHVRKNSIILAALQNVPSRISPASTAVSLSDYCNILAVLKAVHENLPVRGLLTGVPMLLALDSATQAGDSDTAISPLLQACNQIVARVWMTIGKVWNCQDVAQLAEETISAIPQELTLPSLPDPHPRNLASPQEPIPFTSEASPTGPLPNVDTQALLTSVASSQTVQEATGLDEQALVRRLTAHWTAASAFKESMETNTSYDSLRRDGLSPLVKVAPTLMHIENLSLQSLARSAKGVGVTELRDALEGRSSTSNPNLTNKAPSISTLDHTSSMMPRDVFTKLTPTRSRPRQSKLAGPGEVRDVLNKLGIGKQSGSPHLKSSYPALQKAETR